MTYCTGILHPDRNRAHYNNLIWTVRFGFRKWSDAVTHTHTIANCYKKVTEWRRCENLPSLDRCDLRCRRRLPEAVYILPQKSHLLHTVPGIIISCSTVTVNCHTFPLGSDQVKQDIKKCFLWPGKGGLHTVNLYIRGFTLEDFWIRTRDIAAVALPKKGVRVMHYC